MAVQYLAIYNNENQCARMARLFVQYFAVYTNETLANSIKITNIGFKTLPN